MRDLREVWSRAAADLADLDAAVATLTNQLFVASDETGGIEVTLDGRGRLGDLRLDARQLSTTAAELSSRINHTLWAAQEFMESALDDDFIDIGDRAAHLAAHTRAAVEDAAGDPTS